MGRERERERERRREKEKERGGERGVVWEDFHINYKTRLSWGLNES